MDEGHAGRQFVSYLPLPTKIKKNSVTNLISDIIS